MNLPTCMYYVFSTLIALLTISSLYGFSSLLSSSILSNSTSESISPLIVSLLIKLPSSTFLYINIYFVCLGDQHLTFLVILLLTFPNFPTFPPIL